ncbi:MAG: hypothetical protein JRJ85_07290 [Deltaproteobacteria bacterium]|nr:hypothetical protein [Deltaproteobacteria bacterium]
MFKTLLIVCCAGVAALLVMVKGFGYNPIASGGANTLALSELKLAAGSQLVHLYKKKHFTMDVNELFKVGTFHNRDAIWDTSPGVELSVLTIDDGENFFVMEAYHMDGTRLYRYALSNDEQTTITSREFEYDKNGDFKFTGQEELLIQRKPPILK